MQDQRAHGMASAIEALVHFCSDVNVGTRNESEQCLLKALVCNMQYIERRPLYAQAFGEDSYVNWEVHTRCTPCTHHMAPHDHLLFPSTGSTQHTAPLDHLLFPSHR